MGEEMNVDGLQELGEMAAKTPTPLGTLPSRATAFFKLSLEIIQRRSLP